MPSRWAKNLVTCAAMAATGICIAAAGAAAAPKPVTQMPRPAVVLYFAGETPISRQHAQMISRMVRELTANNDLLIEEIPLEDEAQLPARMQKIADEDIGMVLIVEPRNADALARIPSLYPDISFSIIAPPTPMYFANVRAMHFRDHEGAYMMGTLAALRTQKNIVAFVSSQDSPATRNLAYAFLQGAKRVNPEVTAKRLLGISAQNAARVMGESAADILYIQEEGLLEPALASARAHKQLLITNNHDITDEHPGLVLTSLLKHYDLAMYQTLRGYSRGEWRPGTQSMGIGNGFIDYVLTASNKSLIPKETVEQLETTKDFVSQGLVQVNSLAQ